MQTASELLKFTFSPIKMKEAALSVFSESFKKSHESKINRLIEISKEMGASTFEFFDENLISQVFIKFKKLYENAETLLGIFARRELRTLAFSLDHSENHIPAIYQNLSELNLVLRLLEPSWRDSFLIGLIGCYLKNWGTANRLSAKKLGGFIYEKLKKYSGSRKALLSMQSNIRFFDNERGDFDLGYSLALKNIPINEAVTYLNFPEAWFSYTYFSKVILAYYEKQKNEIQHYIDNLNHALQEHNSSMTNQRVISKLVIHADTQNDSGLKDKVKLLAINLIGDPSRVGDWLPFAGATDQEKMDLIKAKSILNEWMTRQFINVFFEKCINDPRRKKFWLKLSKHVTDFKVHGSTYTYNALKDDTRVSEFVENRFQVTRSQKKVSAFFMHIKDYKFIEFSDPGYAFYAYKQNNTNSPSMNENYYHVDSFRDIALPFLVKKAGRNLSNFSSEGRLPHSDGVIKWEDVFEAWIKEKVGLNV